MSSIANCASASAPRRRCARRRPRRRELELWEREVRRWRRISHQLFGLEDVRLAELLMAALRLVALLLAALAAWASDDGAWVAGDGNCSAPLPSDLTWTDSASSGSGRRLANDEPCERTAAASAASTSRSQKNDLKP